MHYLMFIAFTSCKEMHVCMALGMKITARSIEMSGMVLLKTLLSVSRVPLGWPLASTLPLDIYLKIKLESNVRSLARGTCKCPQDIRDDRPGNVSERAAKRK